MNAFLMKIMGMLATDPVNPEEIDNVAKTAYTSFKRIINTVLPIALGVVLLVGTVFAIVLGVQYSKAEDADKRKIAKERLVGAVVGFLITLVLIAVIYGILSLDIFAKYFTQA